MYQYIDDENEYPLTFLIYDLRNNRSKVSSVQVFDKYDRIEPNVDCENYIRPVLYFLACLKNSHQDKAMLCHSINIFILSHFFL